MKRYLGLIVFVALVSPLLVPGTASAARHPLATPGIDYNDYLSNHSGVKAEADNFVRSIDASDARLAGGGNAGYSGDYGHQGCEVAEEYAVGDQETFWISGNVANTPTGNEEISATLAAKSAHGYMWVQDEFYLPIPGSPPEGGFVTQEEAEAGLVDWEGIYGTNRRYFGKEPHPNVVPKNLPPGLPKDWRDADCDARVHILNFPIDTPGTSLGYIAGYYSSEHEYPNGTNANQSPFSNEKEMFFMNSATLDVGGDDYAGVLAHEFFHMIQFGNDYNEATWVNEGMADVAAVVNGFNGVVDGHISAYEDDPDAHLFDWGSDVSDYGQAFLFFDYLFNHYGAPENDGTEELEAYGLAKLLTKTRADGPAGITAVIQNRSDALKNELDDYYQAGSFKKVFKDYLVANYLDLPDSGAGQFGYANRDVAVANAGTEDSSAEDATVHPYGGEYYELTGAGDVQMTAADPVAVIPAKEGMPKGRFFAWSNRGDELLTWLQRGANLTDANSPKLIYKYWYQIEEDWDYAYVRISKNGGRTWKFQNTTACGGKATDPNGNNRAVEESGGITGNSEGWKKCTLDLTNYAGEKILIRFEYDTDQAVSEPGFVVDNVKVKDGQKSIFGPARFETTRSSRSWRFSGSGLVKWMRIKPLAKNRPLYQVVSVNGNGPSAAVSSRRTLTRKNFERDSGRLQLKEPVAMDADKTVLIFSGTTPIATDPFGYSYNVTR